MFLASFLIGLREGLEASLVVGMLLAYTRKTGGPGASRRILWGVLAAVVLTAAISAVSTFGRSRLTFTAQEVIGGSLSLVAVAMVTAMVFWMMTAGAAMKATLEGGVDRALLAGGGAVFWLAFITVAREGIETTLMLWGWVGSLVALGGALSGILIAVGLGWLLFRGMVRIDLGMFFQVSGAFLIVVSAGILAYGIHDLQEAAVLPGPFSGEPITPTHPRTGEVLTGFATYPFWGAAYPFGWAFDLSGAITPDGFLAALLKGTLGFVPQMTWLEVTAWVLYLLVIVPLFARRVRAMRQSCTRAEGPAEAAPGAARPAPPAEAGPGAVEPHPAPASATLPGDPDPRPQATHPTPTPRGRR